MKRIKKVFGRFYLNHPKTTSHSIWIVYILAMFYGVSLAISLGSSGSFSVIFSVGMFFFLVLLFLLWFLSRSHVWTKELPEYFISEAEKILEKNEGSQNLESLIAQVKTSKGENGLDELKNWLKLFRDCESLKENLSQLRKNLSQLYEQQDEITTEIDENVGKKSQLQRELYGIADFVK